MEQIRLLQILAFVHVQMEELALFLKQRLILRLGFKMILSIWNAIVLWEKRDGIAKLKKTSAQVLLVLCVILWFCALIIQQILLVVHVPLVMREMATFVQVGLNQ